MEKQKIFTNEGNGIPPNWNSIFGMAIEASEQLSNGFFNPNWDNSIDQRDLFESALSSIVSSPANSHPGIPIPTAGESIVLRELIGRLGSICNSGEVSPQSHIGNHSTSNSCYNTPLNSPPKLHLSIPGNHQLPPDPRFVERAARFSGLSSKNLGLKEAEFPQTMESEKLSRVSSSQFTGFQDSDKKFSRLLMSSAPETTDSMEVSSVSEQIPGGRSTARKRKAIPKGKGKETPSSTPISAKDQKAIAEPEKHESDAKRSKSDDAKAPEPPKDYIHVRARRGQATDSHSLAERVRREKISERMKFLQDLVPGCNKVTGKAVMLDEIINYVQSLQRQVEFLSMKLATVNPRMDVSMEALLSKDMFRSRVSAPTGMNPFDASTHAFHYGFQSQNNGLVHDDSENQLPVNPLMAAMHRGSNMKPPYNDGFGEASTFWENDLQSVVQMGIGQNQPQSFHGQMKVEL